MAGSFLNLLSFPEFPIFAYSMVFSQCLDICILDYVQIFILEARLFFIESLLSKCETF